MIKVFYGLFMGIVKVKRVNLFNRFKGFRIMFGILWYIIVSVIVNVNYYKLIYI